jgi:hypothetical protein
LDAFYDSGELSLVLQQCTIFLVLVFMLEKNKASLFFLYYFVNISRADSFEALPERPFPSAPQPFAAGRIVHLVSTQEGLLRYVWHLEEINSLPSVLHLQVPLSEGDVLLKTSSFSHDLRTSCTRIFESIVAERRCSGEYWCGRICIYCCFYSRMLFT